MVHTSQEDRRTSGSLSSLSRPHWARHWHLVRWLSTNITISKTRCHKQLFNLKTTAVSNTQTCSDSNIYFYRTWKPLRWKWTSIVGLHKQSIRVFFFFFVVFILWTRIHSNYTAFLLHIFDKRGGFVMQMDYSNTDKSWLAAWTAIRTSRRCGSVNAIADFR